MRSKIKLTVNNGQLTMEEHIFVNCIFGNCQFLPFFEVTQ